MKFIVAMEKNTCGIGLNKEMPWHNTIKVKEDLQFFREKTIGKNIVVGNNTHKGLLKNHIKLDKRNILILSNSTKGEQYYTLDELIQVINNIETKLFDVSKYHIKDDVIICGGKELYELIFKQPELRKHLTCGYVSVIEFKQNQFEFDTDIKDFYNTILKEAIHTKQSVLTDNDLYKVTIKEFQF